MSLEDKKITTYADNIKSLSDRPSDDGISPEQLKEMFDGRGDKEIKSAINGIINELIANTGASQIGSAEGNVQRELDLKVSKENGEAIGTFEVSTWDGEGSVKIIPTIVGGQAQIKLSDTIGSCATLGMNFDGQLTVSYGNEYINEVEKQGEIYTTIDHPKLDLLEAQLETEEQQRIIENLGLHKKLSTDMVCVDTGCISKDGEEIIIYRPMEDTVPESALKIGYDLKFRNGLQEHIVYHSGNLKDLTNRGANLNEIEKEAVCINIGLNKIIGDIESALDGIIALQEKYIGGEAA